MQWANNTARIGGNVGFGLVENIDGSFVMGGDKEIPSSHYDACFTKVDANGNMLWDSTYDIAGFDDYGYDMIATTDGGYIACGRTSFIDFVADTSQVSLLLLKVNCMGLQSLPQAQFTYTPTDAGMGAVFYNTSLHTYADSIDGGTTSGILAMARRRLPKPTSRLIPCTSFLHRAATTLGSPSSFAPIPALIPPPQMCGQ